MLLFLGCTGQSIWPSICVLLQGKHLAARHFKDGGACAAIPRDCTLQAFEPIGGLAVNWVMFGSSGHVQRPEAGVLQVRCCTIVFE